MANKRRREIANGAPEIPQTTDNLRENTINESESGVQASPAGYEQLREQRIKENLERLQKLGIVDLSLKLKSSSMSDCSVKRTPRNISSHRKTPLLAAEHRRRSLRLQNETPVSDLMELTFPKRTRVPRKEPTLKEIAAKLKMCRKVKLPSQKLKRKRESVKLEKVPKNKRKRRGVAMPEIYTEEHEKLLGKTKLDWVLYVDGCGEDGKRIYDPVKGRSCHQCRQKTLGHRTSCSVCQKIQGQFCGDCLYMRYGENVLEANEDPDWICPVCRDICNCSLCRNGKGWPPTGLMYRKILSLGYKSVAHYLIQTKRALPETETESEHKVHKTPQSAKRSLTFNNTEVPADGQTLDYDEPGLNPDFVKEEAVYYNASEGKFETDKAAENEDEKEVGEFEVVYYNASEGKFETDKAAENEDEKEVGEAKFETDKAAENEDEKEVGEFEDNMDPGQDDCENNIVTLLNFGETELNSIHVKEEAENEDEKETGESENDNVVVMNVGEYEINPVDIKEKETNPDESEGILKIDKGCATKACLKATLFTSPQPVQDSIARRLRPRISSY